MSVCILTIVFLVCGPAGAAATVRGIPATTSQYQVQPTIVLGTLAPSCPAQCECMPMGDAQAKWGAGGYTQCSQRPCGNYSTEIGLINYYCFQKKPVTTAIIGNIPSETTTLIAVEKNIPVVTTTTPAVVTADPCLIQGKADCGGTCLEIFGSDVSNCGGCGWKCTASQECNQGVCNTRCPAGETDCQYNCYDLLTDPAHCGSCGNSCMQGGTCCNGKCADTRNDAGNCGSCGRACPDKNQICTNGGCNCKPGFLICDASKGCMNVDNDPQHCGSCGSACPGGMDCIGGKCNNVETDNVAINKPSCGGTVCAQGEECLGGGCIDMEKEIEASEEQKETLLGILDTMSDLRKRILDCLTGGCFN